MMVTKEFRNQYALKQSIYVSAAFVAALTLLYMLGIKYLGGWPRFVITLAWTTYIFIMAFQYRKAVGGYITFKEIFRTLIIVSAISSAVLMIYNFILYNVIDTTLAVRFKELKIQQTYDFMNWIGASKKTTDDAINNMEAQDFGFDAKSVLMGIPVSILVDALFIAIAALVAKKKDPNEGAVIIDESNNQNL